MWVERVGACPTSLPVWPSRAGWVQSAIDWATTDSGLDTLRRNHIRLETFIAIVTAIATFADSATGRNVAATNAVIAAAVEGKCCGDRITTTRRILREAGLAIEAQRGHGRPGGPPASRRPSVWHLITPRPAPGAVDNSPARDGFSDLPRRGVVRDLSPVGKYSPSAQRARRPKSNPPKTAPKRDWRCAPRPLNVQRLAAGVVVGSIGLDHGHIGRICDALTASGLDLAAWTSNALITALNRDMKTRGWDWPNHIENPAAFLASRLRLLAERPQAAPGGGTDASLDQGQRVVQPATYTPVEPVAITPAQQARIDAARAEIRAVLGRDHQRIADPQAPRKQPAIAPLALTATPTDCAVCGQAGGQKRAFLPTHRAHVCDGCWDEAPDNASSHGYAKLGVAQSSHANTAPPTHTIRA